MENKKFETLFKLLYRVKKGFTLIELLVVMAILAVLAAIAIPCVAGFIGRSQWEYWLQSPSHTKSNTILNSH